MITLLNVVVIVALGAATIGLLAKNHISHRAYMIARATNLIGFVVATAALAAQDQAGWAIFTGCMAVLSGLRTLAEASWPTDDPASSGA